MPWLAPSDGLAEYDDWGREVKRSGRSCTATGLVARLPPREFQWRLGTQFFEGFGSGGGTRTPDPRIMIPLLYQLSYSAAETGI